MSSMGERELEEFLLKGRILRVASLDGKGQPHLVPVWYFYEEGKLYFTTDKKTVKARNLARNPSVAFSLDVGEGLYDLRGVVGVGRARLILEPEAVGVMWSRLARKYIGSEEDPAAKELEAATNCLVEITPTKIKSWDYGKS